MSKETRGTQGNGKPETLTEEKLKEQGASAEGQSKELLKKQSEQEDVFTVIKVTTDNEDGIKEAGKYKVFLERELTLSDVRPELQTQLGLPKRWAYVEGAALITTGTESKMKVRDLAGTRNELELRLTRDKSLAKVEADPAEAAKGQLNELSKKLEAVKVALKRPEGGLLSKEDFEALVILNHLKNDGGKWGGDTGTSYRELAEDKLIDIVRSLGLPRAARREPDGSFVMTEFVARLKAPEDSDPVKTLVQQYMVAANEVETRVEKFTEAWQKRSFESGFTNISAALQASFPALGGRAGVSGSYQQSEQTEKSNQDGGSTQYIVGSQEVRKARVFVPFNMIALDGRVQERFVNATKLADGAAQQQTSPTASDEQILKNLEPLLDEYGYFVATEYVLGAKLTTFDELEAKDRTEADAKAKELQIAAALSYKHALGGGDVSGGRGSDESSKHLNKSASERLTFRLQAKGGRATDRYDPQAWVKSIHPDNWEVIAYGRLIPIYEFIEDKSVREFCRKAQERLTDRHFQEAVKRWATNSTRTPGTAGAKELVPNHEGTHNRLFKDLRVYAHTGKVEVPEGQYFRGAQLKVQGNRLTLTLVVVDEHMRLLADVDTDVAKDMEENKNYVVEQLTKGSPLYFDTTPLEIPPGHRITALRLRKLDDPGNRIGIEVTTTEGLRPGVKEKVLKHHGNNNSYIDQDMGDIYLSTARTVAPDDKCIVGIHLAKLGSNNTLGIRLLVRPVGG